MRKPTIIISAAIAITISVVALQQEIAHPPQTNTRQEVAAIEQTPTTIKSANLQAFELDGWKKVDAIAHDQSTISLDPNLLAENETALRQQLETTRVSKAYLNNAVTIALNASEHRTRLAAINSIGYRHKDNGVEQLFMLFEQLDNERERSHVLSFIRTDNLSSVESQWLIQQLNSTNLPSSLEEQLASKLFFIGMLEHKGEKEFLNIVRSQLIKEKQQSFDFHIANLSITPDGAHPHH